MTKLSFVLSLVAILYGITLLLHYNHSTEVCIASAFVLVIGIPILYSMHSEKTPDSTAKEE